MLVREVFPVPGDLRGVLKRQLEGQGAGWRTGAGQGVTLPRDVLTR